MKIKSIRVKDGAVVAAKQGLTHLKTATKHTTDLIVGNTRVTIMVKVLTGESVANAEVKNTDT